MWRKGWIGIFHNWKRCFALDPTVKRLEVPDYEHVYNFHPRRRTPPPHQSSPAQSRGNFLGTLHSCCVWRLTLGGIVSGHRRGPCGVADLIGNGFRLLFPNLEPRRQLSLQLGGGLAGREEEHSPSGFCIPLPQCLPRRSRTSPVFFHTQGQRICEEFLVALL